MSAMSTAGIFACAWLALSAGCLNQSSDEPPTPRPDPAEPDVTCPPLPPKGNITVEAAAELGQLEGVTLIWDWANATRGPSPPNAFCIGPEGIYEGAVQDGDSTTMEVSIGPYREIRFRFTDWLVRFGIARELQDGDRIALTTAEPYTLLLDSQEISITRFERFDAPTALDDQRIELKGTLDEESNHSLTLPVNSTWGAEMSVSISIERNASHPDADRTGYSVQAKILDPDGGNATQFTTRKASFRNGREVRPNETGDWTVIISTRTPDETPVPVDYTAVARAGYWKG